MQKLKQTIISGNQELFAEYKAQRVGRSAIGKFLLLLKLLFHYVVLRREAPCFSYGEEQQFILSPKGDASWLKDVLTPYDVISFDVFDTLLLRLTHKPTDVFVNIEHQYCWRGFARARILAEQTARQKQCQAGEPAEVTLSQIYQELPSKWKKEGLTYVEAELQAEEKLCIANSDLLPVVQALCQDGKTVICVSDMYLSSDQIRCLLTAAGYPELEVIVSCEEGASKYQGALYDTVKRRFPGKRVIHIGDQLYGDYIQARAHGVPSIYYKGIKKYD